jgi:hypothetical protein
MKRLQFKRVNRVLETMLDTCIVSEGMLDRQHPHIVRWGFYPNGRMQKQYIIFNRETGRYNIGVQETGSIGIYTECEGYSIRDLRHMIAEIYPNMI